MDNQKPTKASKNSVIFLIFAELCILAIVIGVLVRMLNLSSPPKQIFDEVYFPVFANNYLHHISFFDVHPPLGKFIIALGIKLFGDASFGWRIVPSILGIAMLGLAPLFWLNYQKDKIGAWILASLIALDGIFIVYSRVGLMDGILAFIILLTLLVAYKAEKLRGFLLLGLVLGLTVDIKWIGLGVIVPLVYILWQRKKLKYLPIVLLISAMVYLLINYLGQVIIHANNPLITSLKWNIEAWNYHFNLKEGHPWGSVWWTWPLLKRPVLFFYEGDNFGQIRTITTLPNPILWWGSMLTVVGSTVYLLWTRFINKVAVSTHPIMPFVLAFYAFWLPWAAVKRVVFLYHFIPSYLFAILIVTYWMLRLWTKHPRTTILLLLILGLVGVYFIPLVTGLPLSMNWLDNHIWVNSWLY